MSEKRQMVRAVGGGFTVEEVRDDAHARQLRVQGYVPATEQEIAHAVRTLFDNIPK